MLAVFCFGCSKNNNPATPSSESVLIPMKIGNMWVYEEKNGYTGKNDIDTLLISKDTLVNGEKYFYFTFASEYN